MFANIGIQFKKKEKKRKQRSENRREKAIKKMQILEIQKKNCFIMKI